MMCKEQAFPDELADEGELDDYLTYPRPELVQFIKSVTGPLVILGAGGKMGPTLAVLAKRAAERAEHRLKVIAVSRFSEGHSRAWLEARGVKTLSADLLQKRAFRNLPESENIIYLVGLKFGTSQNPALTWAVNTLIPAHVMERYSRARVVALSTGNVYPLMSVHSKGAKETHPLTPLGEYANAAVARERIFEHCSAQNGTRVALLRLSYAIDLRYGVLADIATNILRGKPVSLTTGYFNCIWQGDANEMIIRALGLASAPAGAWNLTGERKHKVRKVAEYFGKVFDVAPSFVGRETGTALLSDTSKLGSVLGEPATAMTAMMRWTAAWVQAGGRSLQKPTHFEVRDGQY
jgi:nucleoside-diphosphate-sugar epimerase